MDMNKRLIKWDDLPIGQLNNAINFIKQNSYQNALKVQKDILDIIGTLELYPEKFPLDKYKINNDGSYRAFEKHRYRVAYRVLETEIKIITIRHTSMEPIEY